MFRCVLLTFASFCALVTNTFAADEGSRLYEMRIYFASEGKLDALHARFRDHTLGLFEKHGMTNVGYFVPVGENPERKLVYFLSYPNRQARDASWKAFINDPLWKTAYAESEKTGPLVAPSANPEKLPHARTIRQAEKYFGSSVDFYIDMGKLSGLASTLIEIKNEKVMIKRKGQK